MGEDSYLDSYWEDQHEMAYPSEMDYQNWNEANDYTHEGDDDQEEEEDDSYPEHGEPARGCDYEGIGFDPYAGQEIDDDPQDIYGGHGDEYDY